MIEYRSFHNADPPQLVRLWHAGQLGRGAAEGFSYDAFEILNFAQPYFDPDGLIVAVDENQIVGFVHAGFGPNEMETGLCREEGVICAVLVHPQYRRRGIGRELISRAEAYLQSAGSTRFFAGPATPRDPFYVGLYGGSQPAGFLESDENAAPFMAALGYQLTERHAVYFRDLAQQGDPVNFRLINIRRKMQLSISDEIENPSWWWSTRYGRVDSIRFQLVPKAGGDPVACLNVVGLDLYMQKWQQRAIGLIDLTVAPEEIRKGYAQTLIVDVCRRLKEELVTAVEAHTPESNTAAIALLESAGFTRIDTGIVYRRET